LVPTASSAGPVSSRRWYMFRVVADGAPVTVRYVLVLARCFLSGWNDHGSQLLSQD
jgi:hypothetical protein